LTIKSGFYRKNFSDKFSYNSFVPHDLPPSIKINKEIMNLVIEANKKIAILDSMVEMIPDVNLFISMYVRKEAVLSSQIEGTQVSLDDILNPETEENENLDVGEVVNYIKAMEFVLEKLKILPICGRLIKETHSVLLNGLRGAEKSPGEYRKSQNWIGGSGISLQKACFVPPNPEDMINSMSNLEKYINSEDDRFDVLIKTALIHYQFETIHPFLDGNGRMGRLLIIIFLIKTRIIKAPVLYVSYFLKKNRTEYYDRMMEVRQKGNYEGFIKFFLFSLKESAENGIETINLLCKVRQKSEQKIESLGRAKKNALKLLRFLEKAPIVNINGVAKFLNIQFNSASRIIKRLVDLEILCQNENKKRNRTFSYTDYLEVLRKDT